MNADSTTLEIFLALAAETEPAGEGSARSPTWSSAFSTSSAWRRTRTAPALRSAPRSAISSAGCRPPEQGTPIFLNAHLDTVPPTADIEPVVEDGVVTNRLPTILGADNKAAVAAMLAAVRDLRARPRAARRD